MILIKKADKVGQPFVNMSNELGGVKDLFGKEVR